MSPNQLLQVAIKEHVNGNLRNAEFIYKALILLDRKNADAYNNLGLIKAAQQKYNLAVYCLVEALTIKPENIEYQNNKNKLQIIIKKNKEEVNKLKLNKNNKQNETLIKSNDYKLRENLERTDIESIDEFIDDYKNKSSSQKQKNSATQLNLKEIILLISGRNWKEAEKKIITKLINEGADINAWKAYNVCQLKRGETFRAVISGEIAAYLKPEDIDNLNNLGNAYREMDRQDEALRCYLQAFAYNEEHATTCNHLGVLALDQGRLADAERYLTKSININSKQASAYTNLGNLNFKLKQYKKSEYFYKKSINIEPANVQALTNLGALYREKARFSESILLYKEALKYEPENFKILNNLGVTYVDLKNIDEATNCYEMALKLKPDSKETKLNLASVYREKGNYTAAKSLLGEVLNQDENFAEAYNNMGIVCMHMREYNTAIDCFERALKINPRLYTARSNLLFCSNYHPEYKPEQLFEIYQIQLADV